MSYGLQVNKGRLLVGERDEIKPVIVGVLLASGHDGVHSVQIVADELLEKVDAFPEQVHTANLRIIGALQVWKMEE